MKRLYLLRHAQALSTGESDEKRHLSDNGKAQAQALHDIIRAENHMPDFIACSPAIRTRQTCDLAFPEFKDVEYPDSFFYITPGDLISYIQGVDDDHESALIINHNPTIQQLAFSLCEHGDEAALHSVALGYRPCTLSVIDCPIDHWKDLRPAENTLKALIPPAQ